MKGTLKLKNPIMVDGKKVKEVAYDFDALTVQDLMNAFKASRADGGGLPAVAEFDAGYQMAVSAYAVQKANSSINYADAQRIQGADAVRMLELGRSFLMGAEDADGEETTSEQP